MNRLKFIGRGSCFNVQEGNTSAYYKNDDKMLLIDCGESTFQRIVESDLLGDVKKLYIAITHLHSDHIGSLPSLIFYCYYVKNISVELIYDDKDKLISFLTLTGVSSYLYKIYSGTWSMLSVVVCDTLTISPFIVNHTDMVCYGYHITFRDSDSNDIIYTGDTKNVYFKRYEETLKKGGILYHDVSLADYPDNIHTSLNQLEKSIPMKYRKQIYCMHLDCDSLITEATNLGFNVVEVEPQFRSGFGKLGIIENQTIDRGIPKEGVDIKDIITDFRCNKISSPQIDAASEAFKSKFK